MTCCEARRSRTGNHLQGNPGLDLERHIRDVAAERGFAIRQPHRDPASKRLFIDLYHLEAEAWWDSGEASGFVHVPPNGKILHSKRPYRGLYPFQRAAINAAYGNRHIQPENPTAGAETESMHRVRGVGTRAFTTGLAEAAADHVEERRELTTLPQADTIPTGRQWPTPSSHPKRPLRTEPLSSPPLHTSPEVRTPGRPAFRMLTKDSG